MFTWRAAEQKPRATGKKRREEQKLACLAGAIMSHIVPRNCQDMSGSRRCKAHFPQLRAPAIYFVISCMLKIDPETQSGVFITSPLPTHELDKLRRSIRIVLPGGEGGTCRDE